ncbi:MAG TPA: phage holin family protein [Candidatus Paceibacterota bacterium]|nr:phage holin family protein [Candidatus Paceibacterota bacterium]
MRLFFHWFVSAIAIAIATYLVPDTSITVSGALIAAVVLGALNLLIRPLLFILTLPLNIVTLGLFSLVINAVLVLIASAFVTGFEVYGFWNAFLFGIVLSIVNWLFDRWR